MLLQRIREQSNDENVCKYENIYSPGPFIIHYFLFVLRCFSLFFLSVFLLYSPLLNIEFVLSLSLSLSLCLSLNLGRGFADGHRQRLVEFEQFEEQFKACLSSSAIHTKFEKHHQCGMEILVELDELLRKEEHKILDRRYCEIAHLYLNSIPSKRS